MKKMILLGFLLSSFLCFSQNEYQSNEFKIDGFGLFFNRIGIGYERILNSNSGIGARVFMKKTESYYAMPYYRRYLHQDAYASDLFLEGFAMYGSYIPRDSENNLLDNGKRNSMIGAGFGIGEKAILQSGFFFEGVINVGTGKSLQPTTESEFKFIAQVSASVGYRF